ncbi:MAG: PAS domain S-box protein [Undibacterium sp.]|nr:PAS domain S-box protein [Opitutaceae bacterium]
MPQPIKVLIAEDNPDDAALIVLELHRAGFEPDWKRVDTETAYLEQLNSGLDLVVSDFHMPQFTGMRALELLKERGLDVPFILVSGTIGEDTAVEAMKSGATDYLLKDRLARLGQAVGHALARSRAIRERAHTKEILNESERRFRELLENVDLIAVTLDRNGTVTFSNDYLLRLTGRRRAEVMGASWFALFLPGADPVMRETFIGRVAAGLVPVHYENAICTRDNEWREIVWSNIVLRDGGGHITGIASIGQDVTDRRRAEQSLRLLGSAVEQATESIMITDAILDRPGPKIVFVNPAFMRMTGFSAEDVLGKTPRILQGPRTDPGVLRRLRQNLERGELFEGEAVNYRKDRTEYYEEWRIAPLRDAQGIITHFVAILRDITERKRAENALRTSEQRFKAFFQQAAVGVAQTDAANGRYLQVNQRFCDIAGRTKAELEHLTFAAITHPQDLGHSLEMTGRLRSGAIREFTQEKRYVREGRPDVWANVTVSSMWNEGDAPDFFIVVAQDITARKRLEEQFLQAQKMEAIGTLAGGVAHDFNNILAAINGYTELSLLILEGNPEVRGHLVAVLQASGRATDLVRQILTFSRQQKLERRPLQLRPVVVETLKLLRATIPTTIEFDISLATDAPVVLADSTQIHQVLMNLGTNAWHAMKDRPGRLQVKLERCVVDPTAAVNSRLRPGLYAHISVSDSGCGMGEETRRRIFEPFFTTKPLGEGTGLGMAVVHGIMDTHDGAVTVYSQPGEGTVFHLYFPANAGETTLPPPPDDPVPRGHGERVLLVDDEELLVRLGKIALTALGYEVEVATQPDAAIALVRADPQRFALVLTDQTMPGMTGLMLANQLRKLCPGLPIILTTGYTMALTSQVLAAAGICQLLPKPTTLHDLGVAVRAAISGRPPR